MGIFFFNLIALSRLSVCFYNSLKKNDRAKLSKVTTALSKLIGSVVGHLQAYFERKTLQRLKAVLADPTHALNEELTPQTSTRVTSRRLVSKYVDESFSAVISAQHNTRFRCH